MKKSVPNLTRRRFIAGSMLIPLVDLSRPLLAQDLPPLSETDPTAAALGYHHDATKVNPATFPRRSTEPGGDTQFCDNCVLYIGAPGNDWGPCALFPGKSVAAKGWCNVWAAKPA